MKKLIFAVLLLSLVPFALKAQLQILDQKPTGAQQGSTVKSQTPIPAPSTPSPGVQNAATVTQQPSQPAPALQQAATVKPQPALAAKPAPPQPATKEPEKKAKETQPKPEAKPEKPEGSGPMAWGTDFWQGTVRANWWDADYEGSIKAVKETSGILIGESLDLVDDLKLKTPASVWEGEFSARPSRRNRIFGSYMFSSYNGKVNMLPQEIEFGGKIFNVGSDIETKLTNNRGSLYYQFLPIANKRGGVGPLIGVEYLNFRIQMNSHAADEKVDESLNVPVPVIGAAGDYTIGYGLGVWGKVGWIGASISDLSANYTDLEAGLSFKRKLLFAGLGYRNLAFDVESGKKDKDGYLRFNTRQSGVLASLGINF